MKCRNTLLHSTSIGMVLWSFVFCIASGIVSPGLSRENNSVAHGVGFVDNDKEDAATKRAYSSYLLMPGDKVELLLEFDISPTEIFTLSSGDQIEVVFVNTPDLTIEQKVRPDGKIALPYIGDVHVVDSTPLQVRRQLMQAYSKELSNPEIVVVLKERGGYRQELTTAVMKAGGGMGKQLIVQSDGYISIPFAGEVYVAHLTLSQAEKKIQHEYSSQSISAGVDLIVQRPAGSRISVLGAVRNPGGFVIEHPVSILEAIGKAGGMRDDAAMNNCVIIRTAGDSVSYTKINVHKMIKPGSSDDIVALEPNSVLFVPRKGLAKASDISRYIGQILLFRGFTFGFGSDVHIFPE